MAGTALTPAGDALAEIERQLDLVDPVRSGVDAATRLDWVRKARRVRGRLDALTSLLVAEADRVRASEQEMGTPMAAWLGMGEALSRREASAAVHQARSMIEHPLVAEAATSGRLGSGQVRAIVKVLDGLAVELSSEQRAHAEARMVKLGEQLDADQLGRSTDRVLNDIAPADADRVLETGLQRQAEAAQRCRSLRFFRDQASVRFEGSLPRTEGEVWIALLDAHGEHLRRNLVTARDPLAEKATPEQRRADAFIALLHAAANSKPAPGVGTARVIVTLNYDRLAKAAAGAGIIGEGEQLSAGELRRLCCDAEIIPAVLGEQSEPLDVGRSRRLVTPPIRTALIVRDGGCAFPGCDIRPNLCEAHHITPWWAGGRTSLMNLVMLCHVHHSLVEPAKSGIRDQWEVRIAEGAPPEFIPPARLDRQRRPMRHQRHTRDEAA